MTLRIYSIYDSVSKRYLNPTFEESDAVAYRNFSYLIQTSSSVLSTHRTDFALYYVGTFDSSTGIVSRDDSVLVCRGDDIRD